MCQTVKAPLPTLDLSSTLLNRLPQDLDDLCRVLGPKDGTSSDDDVGARISSLVDRAGTQATVNLDVELGVPLTEGLDLGQLASHELLAAEARLDRHDEDHVGTLGGVGRVEQLVQHVGRRGGLDGDAGQQALVVDVTDQLAGARLGVRRGRRLLGRAAERRLVVEAVQVAPGRLELLHPLLGLRDHHVAVKRALAVRGLGPVDVAPDLGHHGRAKGDVGYEVTIPGEFGGMAKGFGLSC